MAGLKQLLLSAVVLAGGSAMAWVLLESKPQAAHAPAAESAMPVEVMVAARTDEQVRIRGLGEVEPVRSVVLQPEVSGRVASMHPNLVPGGHVQAGDVLLELDRRDYKAAISAQNAAVAQAAVLLEEERASKRVAEYEWKGAEGIGDDTRKFATREPHIESARATVSSARGQLARAKRNLSRTKLIAPFEAVVLRESVDQGQIVGPANPVATLAGIDRFWVRVALPVPDLRMLQVPGISTVGAEGSRAFVFQDVGNGEQVSRDAFVERLIGAVDKRGKLAQVLVAVNDPFSLALPPGERPLPLLIGTFVDVEIQGNVLEDVIALPREALQDGDRVWVVDAQSRLETRVVEVRWREETRVLVASGIEAGERVVVTPLTVATPGMAVAVQHQRQADQLASSAAGSH